MLAFWGFTWLKKLEYPEETINLGWETTATCQYLEFHPDHNGGKGCPNYRNDPKCLDRQIWANSPDQILKEQSDQGLHCLPFRLHLLDALPYGKATLLQFSGDCRKLFQGSEFLGTLWYSVTHTFACQTIFFFIRVLRPVKIISLFLSRVNQKVGAKMGDLREKLGLSHMWPELGSKGSNPQRWDDERFRVLKINNLNHSATGAARNSCDHLHYHYAVKIRKIWTPKQLL